MQAALHCKSFTANQAHVQPFPAKHVPKFKDQAGHEDRSDPHDLNNHLTATAGILTPSFTNAPKPTPTSDTAPLHAGNPDRL